MNFRSLHFLHQHSHWIFQEPCQCFHLRLGGLP